jgi:Zn-dependent M28 family amino/carboxypeptidase
VCLEIIRIFKRRNGINRGLRVFFFDQEEVGLKGSAAYVRDFGFKDLTAFINMEVVGMGDEFALWPLDESSQGNALSQFEAVARRRNVLSKRFDQIITNTADHLFSRQQIVR